LLASNDRAVGQLHEGRGVAKQFEHEAAWRVADGQALDLGVVKDERELCLVKEIGGESQVLVFDCADTLECIGGGAETVNFKVMNSFEVRMIFLVSQIHAFSVEMIEDDLLSLPFFEDVLAVVLKLFDELGLLWLHAQVAF
jgi:hypothetical protein